MYFDINLYEDFCSLEIFSPSNSKKFQSGLLTTKVLDTPYSFPQSTAMIIQNKIADPDVVTL